eukprot:844267-Prorocentrum_minimum.AAC.3
MCFTPPSRSTHCSHAPPLGGLKTSVTYAKRRAVPRGVRRGSVDEALQGYTAVGGPSNEGRDTCDRHMYLKLTNPHRSNRTDSTGRRNTGSHMTQQGFPEEGNAARRGAHQYRSSRPWTNAPDAKRRRAFRSAC